jgi:hypothetical protein
VPVAVRRGGPGRVRPPDSQMRGSPVMDLVKDPDQVEVVTETSMFFPWAPFPYGHRRVEVDVHWDERDRARSAANEDV